MQATRLRIRRVSDGLLWKDDNNGSSGNSEGGRIIQTRAGKQPEYLDNSFASSRHARRLADRGKPTVVSPTALVSW